MGHLTFFRDFSLTTGTKMNEPHYSHLKGIFSFQMIVVTVLRVSKNAVFLSFVIVTKMSHLKQLCS